MEIKTSGCLCRDILYIQFFQKEKKVQVHMLCYILENV